MSPGTVTRDSSGAGIAGQRGLWGLGIDSLSSVLLVTQVTSGDTGLALPNRTKSHWREAYVVLMSKGGGCLDTDS